MRALLDAVRAACSPRDWSRGVELARVGAVAGVRRERDEVVLRVAIKGAGKSPTVALYPGDAEWSCDCDDAGECCFHVAAAAIALQRAVEAGEALPRGSERAGRVGYRLRRAEGALELVRMRVSEGTGPESKETPLGYSLAAITGGKVEGPGIVATAADFEVESALGIYKRGPLAPVITRKLIPALAGCEDVTLDGKKLTAGVEPAGYHGRVAAFEGGKGFRLYIVRDPTITEVFPASGVVLCGEVLRCFDNGGIGPKEAAELRVGLQFTPERAGELVAEAIPALRARVKGFREKTDRLPVLSDARPRVVFEVGRAGTGMSVLPVLVYGTPESARVEAGRLVIHGREVPRRDALAEASLVRRLSDLGLQFGRTSSAVGPMAVGMAEALRGFEGGEIAGESHREFVRKGPLHARMIDGEGGRLGIAFETGSSGHVSQADARRVIEAWQAGASEVVLDDGGVAPLPVDWLSRFGTEVALLLAAREQGSTPAAWAGPALAELCRALNHPPPPELAGLAALVEGFEAIPETRLPDDLQVELRPYQRRGVDWLAFLREAGLGGLLADDMGLGKTLQALCAVRGRTLVVAPTSVIHNWAAEAEKFRPGLRVSVYHGPKRRLDPQADLTLTSYALLRLDAEALAGERWDAVILDEAQAIKNPESQVARAAFGLQADWCLAMTGTPVENRLDELWSQIHFINPGLLGGRADFQERFGRPIGDGDQAAARALRRRIAPFVLRRRKQEVARELPPRTEVVLRCTLDARERAVYDAVRAATHEEVVAQLQAGGGVLAALEALLRLRQAACHAALVPGQSAARSSKLDLLLETLAEAIAEGHKALVFSQWTSLLDLCEPGLKAAGLSFCRLDGSTRDRAGVVNRFQDPDGPPVMLISLKAGGTGLNLTAADHVFLLDPWWNPAVEDQAADRAHRIGQERPVIVHRLVAEDTVEERILALQGRKRAIAQAALEDAAGAAAITRSDLLALLE
ncbi:DEAD/DEAH box helicase [Nannocystis bainbridge]|uniref:DEAD/DEAH box helicase n=1 Tax=Nannocystis bainbridge TaxID=2995303 RepID=A0ABT5DYZ8_9BACT|nr:DEAD/DEAH box helicase [Nannocystis bainbridge]MDC0718838.1 DEAD/DEAH box helicase [Nannocystis bainbridge]